MIEAHIPIVRELERQMRRDGARAPGRSPRARPRFASPARAATRCGCAARCWTSRRRA